MSHRGDVRYEGSEIDFSTSSSLILLLVFCFGIKHFVADFLLQFPWMIKDKGDLARPGGYLHAGIHAIGTGFVLLLAPISLGALLLISAIDFLAHYALDFFKARTSDQLDVAQSPRLYWALFGLDQLFHHFTYIGLIYLVVVLAP